MSRALRAVTYGHTVAARARGKINLSLRVGPKADDGFHPLVTVFQAVNLAEDVTVEQAAPGSGVSISVSGDGALATPRDESNLAWRAALAVAERASVTPDVTIHIRKTVPVAGGMAGGSADAAATLVACNALWDAGLDDHDLWQLGASLGSDVPFSLMGGTAVGTGRGHILSPVMARGTYHWAVATFLRGLPTPEVFLRYDEIAADGPADWTPMLSETDAPLLTALRSGDATELGPVLRNDLQQAVIDLRPELGRTFEVAHDAGAAGVIVSGAGPSVAALARSEADAHAIAKAWQAAEAADRTLVTSGPAHGARLI